MGSAPGPADSDELPVTGCDGQPARDSRIGRHYPRRRPRSRLPPRRTSRRGFGRSGAHAPTTRASPAEASVTASIAVRQRVFGPGQGPAGSRRSRWSTAPPRSPRPGRPTRTAPTMKARRAASQRPTHRPRRTAAAAGAHHMVNPYPAPSPHGGDLPVSPRRDRPFGPRRWRAAPGRSPGARSCRPRERSPGWPVGAPPAHSARRAGSSCPAAAVSSRWT